MLRLERRAVQSRRAQVAAPFAAVAFTLAELVLLQRGQADAAFVDAGPFGHRHDRRVGAGRTQLRESAVVEDESRQIVGQRQLFEHLHGR